MYGFEAYAVVNGREYCIRVLPDSGANVSTITSSLAAHLSLEIRPLPRHQHYDITLSDGRRTQIKHHSVLNFRIGDFYTFVEVGVTPRQKSMVFEDLEQHDPVLLGVPWLDANNVTMQFGHRRSVLVGETRINLMAGVPLYCICNQPDDGRPMQECDSGECRLKWYHWDCVHLEREMHDHEIWYCQECHQRMGRQTGGLTSALEDLRI